MTPEQEYIKAMVAIIEALDLRDDQCDAQVNAVDALTALKMSFEDEWGQPVGEQPLMGDLG